MLRSEKVAITGGLSSGKSEVCRIFEKHGAYVINADKVGHYILENDLTTISQIQELFGSDILDNGKIDRKRLAKKVFSHEGRRKQIERILHPRIAEEIQKATSRRREPLVVVEVPLLFETNGERDYDKTIAVIASENRCKERSLKKGFDYAARMQHQLTPAEKAARADFVIHNDGTIGHLEHQVENIIDLLNHEG